MVGDWLFCLEFNSQVRKLTRVDIHRPTVFWIVLRAEKAGSVEPAAITMEWDPEEGYVDDNRDTDATFRSNVALPGRCVVSAWPIARESGQFPLSPDLIVTLRCFYVHATASQCSPSRVVASLEYGGQLWTYRTNLPFGLVPTVTCHGYIHRFGSMMRYWSCGHTCPIRIDIPAYLYTDTRAMVSVNRPSTPYEHCPLFAWSTWPHQPHVPHTR